MTNENTKLWDSVCKTDPSHTKKFTKGGGFSGTAIKPFWLMRRATEIFGPCGIGWGWEEIENKVVAGVWCSKVRLWYLLAPSEAGIPGTPEGRIEQWGQTVMEGTNKNGSFVDEEAPKKAMTDAVTKCLSYLGFAGDVHMGLFDDSKYVSETRKEFDSNAKAQESRPTAQELYGTAKARTDRFNAIAAELRACTEHHELGEVWKANQAHIKAMGAEDDQIQAELVKIKDQCKTAIEQAKVAEASFSQGFNETKY